MGDDSVSSAARETKLLRDSPRVAMGQFHVSAALEKLVDHSACLSFFQIISAFCLRSTSSDRHDDQRIGRHCTGWDTCGVESKKQQI